MQGDKVEKGLTFAAALVRYAYAVRVARADPVEAMHGHYCGPGCMHVPQDEEGQKKLMDERGWKEWPSVVMERWQKEGASA